MQQAFAMTLDHLKNRIQFGVPIGSFQALKHRAANVFIEIELAKSAVMAAARAVDGAEPELAKLVSLAKARCSDAYVLTANEGLQMFGGVGMTDEYDIGFYMKRARAAELTFGDAAFHRARWASLAGY
jgi:acyl-CoA dehydrogenase